MDTEVPFPVFKAGAGLFYWRRCMVDQNRGRDYWKDFFEHSPIGLHAFGPDRKIIQINETELDMLGYSREEIVGKKSWADLIVPSQVPLFERHWHEINTKGEVRNLRYTVVRKDGRQLNVLLNASARFDKSNRLINTRGIVVNVQESYWMAHAMQEESVLGKSEAALLACLESEKFKLQNAIQRNVEETILPLVAKLKRRGSAIDKRHLMLLEKYVQDLAGGIMGSFMDSKWKLSGREMEICRMLQKGLMTKDIADVLCTSMRTIEHHRNHIRKKIGISKSNIDLAVYLKSFSVGRL